MVFGIQPICSRCNVDESPIWHRDGEDIICTQCHCTSDKSSRANTDAYKEDNTAKSSEERTADNQDVKESDDNGKDKKEEEEGKSGEKKESKRKTRKGRQGGKGNISKGKGRRYIFKKSATRAPAAVATPVTSEYLFYKGTYIQVGDIVSLVDIDGGTYYAQIRGLLQDQYCEKSAVITWLLPTKKSPPAHQSFDPSSYIIGPEEDIPRKLEFMDFVCHAPSDYFKDRTSPYSTVSYQPESCFVWSRLGPQIKPIEKAKELMLKQ